MPKEGREVEGGEVEVDGYGGGAGGGVGDGGCGQHGVEWEARSLDRTEVAVKTRDRPIDHCLAPLPCGVTAAFVSKAVLFLAGFTT